MGYNGMYGQTDDMRTAAGQLTEAKPALPPWTASPVPAGMMGGVTQVGSAVAGTVQRGQGFTQSVADGFDLFSQITLLCASDYDNSDTIGAESIARTAAANMAQVQAVDTVNQADYFGIDGRERI